MELATTGCKQPKTQARAAIQSESAMAKAAFVRDELECIAAIIRP